MTRDSHGWYVVAFGMWLTSVAADPVMLERLLELDRKAIVSALCQLVAILGAYFKASPLPISDHGRRKYLRDRVRVAHDHENHS